MANPPRSAPTLRMNTQAMACEFAVVLNQFAHEHADAASFAFERVHALEECMTVYREDAELVRVNQSSGPVEVSEDLARVVAKVRELFDVTDGYFDPTTGPLIQLWRDCRTEQRVPSDDEVTAALARIGGQHVHVEENTITREQDVQINLGAIGKGFALDEAGKELKARGANDWLIHGGRSSILASGDHNNQGGWPVGIGNPVFTNERLGVFVLKDEALGTSGSNIQYFRHGGKRYGHILNPKTGWPADQVASVTVLAPTAAEADALSTAFFAAGVEFAREWCDNRPEIRVILVPFPTTGRIIEPVLVNIPADRISWSSDQVRLP